MVAALPVLGVDRDMVGMLSGPRQGGWQTHLAGLRSGMEGALLPPLRRGFGAVRPKVIVVGGLVWPPAHQSGQFADICRDNNVQAFDKICRHHVAAAAALALSLVLPHSIAGAAGLDVLWYTYSDPLSTYRSELLKVAAQAATDPLGHGNQWHITWWEAGTPAPEMSGFEVLVTHSGEGFETGPPGAAPPGYYLPNFTTLLQSSAAIQGARGDRTAIVNSDLDYHSVVRGSGNNIAASCDPHGEVAKCDFYDGARGQLTNLIDWAGSGHGMGVVALFDGEFLPGGYWWDKDGSFLKNELQGTSHPFRIPGRRELRENFPLLTATESALPLNQHLSSQGLSQWTWSYHGLFTEVPTGYVSALSSSTYPGKSLVLVTAATANGALTSAIPEPASVGLLLAGLGVMGWKVRYLRRLRGNST